MRSLLATAIVILPLTAWAQTDSIEVDHVWARPALEGRTGAVYFTINDKGEADALIGVSSTVAAQTELHESFDDHGIIKMRPVAALPVDTGKPVTLAPGGYHVMLMELKQALQPGDQFQIRLMFAKAGVVTATVDVVKPGGGATEADHGGMSMPMSGEKKQP